MLLPDSFLNSQNFPVISINFFILFDISQNNFSLFREIILNHFLIPHDSLITTQQFLKKMVELLKLIRL